MKTLIKPWSQVDVLRNREITLEHIRGLTAAAKIIAEEERSKAAARAKFAKRTA